MTDLEITSLCAKAMRLETWVSPIRGTIMRHWFMAGTPSVQIEYNPLQNNAQAMELAKYFRLFMCWNESATEPRWDVFPTPDSAQLLKRLGVQARSEPQQGAHNEDLNRAICECVAKMQASRSP